MWCETVEVLRRGAAATRISASDLPEDARARLAAPRAPIAGVTLERPRVMGILNVTPNSFSDGGQFGVDGTIDPATVASRALAMVQSGADILDIGGESTRPGAREVPTPEEIGRVVPAIAAVRAAGITAPISLDTRKAAVAQAGFVAGASVLNDVSGFAFDPALGPWAAAGQAPTCLMHAQGTPETMQLDPRYDDALLDVYDALEAMAARAEALGLPRDRVMLDPGIGFGKTRAHTLAILRGLSLFHSLGCAILLGVSRKSFIGALAGVERAADRDPGSLALALAAVEQGVQILRVHDVAGTCQGLTLWSTVQQPAGASAD
jgi:dihydropteroate synthase